MIAHVPEVATRAGRTRVAARLEYRNSRLTLPDTLWVEFPSEQRPGPCDRADAFAPALLHLAMTLGEPLELKGAVCPRLLYGLEQYQEAFLVLYPGKFQRCKITAEQVAPPALPRESPVVCQAFSGGVDSFHTLRQHLPGGSPPQRLAVTHALMVHGFDVPLADEKSFAGMTAAYRPLLAELGVQLLTARTNFREVTASVHWEISHGAALAFVAFALGPAIGTFLISSTQAHFELVPWGSDPRFDYWLATERTEFMHYGAHRSRTEKLLEIADWVPAQRGLRVCWEKPAGINNCCRCSKCLRTMACLKAAGQLAHYPTFPLPYDRRFLRRLIHEDEIVTLAARNVLEVARRMGNAELAADVAYTLRRTARHRQLSRMKGWIKDRFRGMRS